MSSIAALYPNGCRDLKDGGTWRNLAGQPTDDSELALLLARTLEREGRHDPAAVLAAYVDWVNDPQTFDVGGTIGQALRAASRATTNEDRLRRVEAEASRSSQSNGSLMRISPLGIFYAGRPDAGAAQGASRAG